MARSKAKALAAAIVAAGLGGAVLYERHQNQQLREQLAEALKLREELTEPAERPPDDAEAERQRAERAELLRLRGEVTLLRQQLRERPQPMETAPNRAKPQTAEMGADFVAAETWQNVGFDTPSRAFESFLAILKSGNGTEINGVPHWEVDWKEDPTPEEIALVEKSRQDYIEMLQRAGAKISGFKLAPASEDGDRTRVFFETLTATGEKVGSNFEMVHTGGFWKPVLSMGWRKVGESHQFWTSPVFGPKIDLEP